MEGKPKAASRAVLALSAVVIALVAGLAGFGIAAIAPGGADAPQQEDAQPAAQPAAEAPGEDSAAACEHAWQTLYAVEDSPAETHVEQVDAVTEEVTELRTVCNVCRTPLDDAVAHREQTGHDYTTNVPWTSTVTTSPAHEETVVDAPATHSDTPVLQWCPLCGETQGLPDDAAE